MEELSESKDISLYRLVSGLEENKYYLTKDIKSMISLTMGDGNHDWLSAKWVGAAIKRLNVAKDKRRTSNGIEVMFDIQKAKDKLEMFK